MDDDSAVDNILQWVDAGNPMMSDGEGDDESDDLIAFYGTDVPPNNSVTTNNTNPNIDSGNHELSCFSDLGF